MTIEFVAKSDTYSLHAGEVVIYAGTLPAVHDVWRDDDGTVTIESEGVDFRTREDALTALATALAAVQKFDEPDDPAVGKVRAFLSTNGESFVGDADLRALVRLVRETPES